MNGDWFNGGANLNSSRFNTNAQDSRRATPGHDVESASIPMKIWYKSALIEQSSARKCYGCTFGLMPSACAILAI
jgi:hypothetical protein